MGKIDETIEILILLIYQRRNTVLDYVLINMAVMIFLQSQIVLLDN